MRRLVLLPVLLLTLACSSKLERSKAEDLIRKDYPVVVPVTVPEKATAEKGSPAHLRLTTLKENLEASGWFTCELRTEGGQEVFTFRLKPDAPKAIKAAPKGGFIMPAAEATFVRVTKMDPTREGVRVMYEIRLEKPTAQFSLFQALHQDVKVGQTKIRYATFEKKKGAWELTGTDEVFRKAE
ncbi:MAG: hypothetical protein HXX12_00890 [Geothrix sp.]|uniref:hypothetical protein n=1 Tax=Geothrix sp. TaxID=1962974 RepID=UPI0017F6D800|nr:hypothetical protein [Geothrix sp.]NWJ39512.1 hypothetical protein [Geothrix sp.]WIL19267.1 MAG: hypothetical protein QOZ81_001773 [Geothrix sp.]